MTGKTQQQGYEVMEKVLERGDAQELSTRLCCSPQLIRNWCREPGSEEAPQGTGSRGPLDRLAEVIDMVRADDGNASRAFPIGHFIADRLGGLFVAVPDINMTPNNSFFKRVDEILRETGEALEVVRKVWCEESPGVVSRREFQQAQREIKEAMAAQYQMLLFLEGQMMRQG